MIKQFRGNPSIFMIAATLFVATPLRPAWSQQCQTSDLNVRTQTLGLANVGLFNGGLEFTCGICIQGDTLVTHSSLGDHVYQSGPMGWELTQILPLPVLKGAGYGRSIKLDGDLLVIEQPDAVHTLDTGSGVVHPFLKTTKGFVPLDIVYPPGLRSRWSVRCAMDLDEGWLIVGEPVVADQISHIDIFQYNSLTQKFDFKQTFQGPPDTGQGLHVSQGWATWQTIGTENLRCLRRNINNFWEWAESGPNMRIPGDDGVTYSPIRYFDHGLAVDFQNRIWMFNGSTWQIKSDGITMGSNWDSQVYILNATHVLQGEIVYEWNQNGSNWLPIGSNKCIFQWANGPNGTGSLVAVSDKWPDGHVIFCETTGGDAAVHSLDLNTSQYPPPSTLSSNDLLDTQPSNYDFFGSAVDVSEDVVVVGSAGDSWDQILSGGSATVFKRNGGSWLPEAVLKSPTPENYDRLGKNVSVSGKGENKVIAFSGDGYCVPGTQYSIGSACAATFGPNGWVVKELIPPSLPLCGSRYGDSLAMFGDKHDAVIAVGAPGGSLPSIYIFRCHEGIFSYETKLGSSDFCSLVFTSHLRFSDINNLYSRRVDSSTLHYSYGSNSWSCSTQYNFNPNPLDTLGPIFASGSALSGQIKLQLRDWYFPDIGEINIDTTLSGVVTAANLAWDQNNHLLIGVTDGSSAKLIRMNCSRFEDEKFQCVGFLDIGSFNSSSPIQSIAVNSASDSPSMVAGAPNFENATGKAFVWSESNAILPGDANNDQKVNGLDVTLVIAFWGVVSDPPSQADFNNDGFINSIDLQIVLANWSQN